MIMKKSFIILSILTCLFCAVSCESVEEIPADLTAGQLLQKGQNAYASSKYEEAERYYLETIKRYGNNLETFVEARYELGHLYMKTKDYQKAYENFNQILQLFQTDKAASIPVAYKKLAQNGIDKIPAEEKEKFNSAKTDEE
jgi:outer membrane protein assembly factor BamD (BamD/ComL family)